MWPGIPGAAPPAAGRAGIEGAGPPGGLRRAGGRSRPAARGGAGFERVGDEHPVRRRAVGDDAAAHQRRGAAGDQHVRGAGPGSISVSRRRLRPSSSGAFSCTNPRRPRASAVAGTKSRRPAPGPAEGGELGGRAHGGTKARSRSSARAPGRSPRRRARGPRTGRPSSPTVPQPITATRRILSSPLLTIRRPPSSRV